MNSVQESKKCSNASFSFFEFNLILIFRRLSLFVSSSHDQ